MMRCLENIVDFLQSAGVELVSENDDGRLNSATNENIILQKLSHKFKEVEISSIRQWFDFKICQKDEIFVNVKISDLNNSAAYNCSSKLGMGYALSGVKNMHFLVINKHDTKDCFYTSLKRIKTLVPNGNNLPFQCNWAENRAFSNRSEIEAMRYILDIYLQSWDKTVKGYPFKLKEMFANNKILESE